MSYVAIPHANDSYQFLPAISAYSAGVAASAGFEIAALRFLDSLSLRQGFERLDREIARRGLAPSALVGLALRSPKPFNFESFATFNEEYHALLAERSLTVDGVNPIARTNVVPLRSGPAQPAIFSAFILQPAAGSGGEDFIVAGAGEVRGDLGPENIVAQGDVSAAGLTAKADFVLGEMTARLKALGADANRPTTVNVYTAHDIDHLSSLIALRLPAVERNGFVHWLTRPPISEIEFEMDCHRYSTWSVI